MPRSSEIPVYVVDAFTGEPFRGNPAGVVVLEREKDEAWMQAFAAEMKHAETAYLVPDGDGFHLRWFTPVNEVNLCGHATLASAHVLWESGRLPLSSVARFRTKSGTLTARLVDGGIEMDFPAEPPVEVKPADIPQGMLEALKSKPTFVGKNRMDYLLELESEDAVRALDPDLRHLATVGKRGFIVTARSHTPGIDFISRFFAPAVGIDEDPVTGSAHCCLAPYWGAKLGKAEMVGYQASPRGGTVGVIHRGDRVALIGKAITVLRGVIE